MLIRIPGDQPSTVSAVISEVAGGGIISDATARAIAAMWQSPSDPAGRIMAALASGIAVPRKDALDAVTASEAQDSGEHVDELVALRRYLEAVPEHVR